MGSLWSPGNRGKVKLAIVSAAVLDAALAELLSLRLGDIPKEVDDFLGLDGDGRAPAGSFGARIQLALLTGLITRDDADILRRIKELRNVFAHRVRVTFLSPSALKITQKLQRSWASHTLELAKASLGEEEAKNWMYEVEVALPLHEEAGQGLLLAVFATYQAYFHRMHDRVIQLGDALAPGTPPSKRDGPSTQIH